MALPALKENNRNRLYSLEEFEELDLPADGNRYELIDGVVKVTPPAGMEHGSIGVEIILAIGAFDPQKRLGKSWAATRFQIAPGFGPAPDVAFITTAHLPPTTKSAVPTRPDLAVEVWSPH